MTYHRHTYQTEQDLTGLALRKAFETKDDVSEQFENILAAIAQQDRVDRSDDRGESAS